MSGEIAKEAYRRMLLVRRFEEKCGQLVALGVIREIGALATGREAIPTSIALARAVSEPLVSATGPYGSSLVMGMDPVALFRSIISGAPEISRIEAPDTQICPSAAVAISRAIEHATSVGPVFCWLDAAGADSSSTLGALSKAQPAGLPIVFLITVTSQEAEHALAGLRFSIEHVDGADVGRIKSLCCEAADRARLQRAASVILVRSTAFQGHLAASQRAPGSKELPRENWDPIARLRQRLLDEYGVSESEVKALEKSAREQVTQAASMARADA